MRRLFNLAELNPTTRAALGAVPSLPANLNDAIAESLFESLREGAGPLAADRQPAESTRPTPEQKTLIERLSRLVDARAAELGVSAEILAPRGEIKALAHGRAQFASLERLAAKGNRREAAGGGRLKRPYTAR